MLAVGDDCWIEDEDGRHAFLVDGKALRFQDALELKDPDGPILITLRGSRSPCGTELDASAYAVDVVREDADAALLIAVAVCVVRLAEKEREGGVSPDGVPGP